MFVCTPVSVWERGAATCAVQGQGCGTQQGMCCGYWLKAELWRDLLGKCHACRRAEADQKKNVWFTEMGCSKFLASKQDLHWTSVFIIHCTFQRDAGFSNSLDKNQAVICGLSEGWVFPYTSLLTIHWSKQENGCSGKPIHIIYIPIPAQSFWPISMNLSGLCCLGIKKLAVVPCSVCWISSSSNCSSIQWDQQKTVFSYLSIFAQGACVGVFKIYSFWAPPWFSHQILKLFCMLYNKEHLFTCCLSI